MPEQYHGQQTSAIYWLVDSVGRRAVFNDPSDPDYVGGLGGEEGVSGLDSPEVRESAFDAPDAHGGYHGRFWASRRPVTLTVDVTPNVTPTIAGREAVLSKLRRVSNLYHNDASLYIFPGDPNIVATTRRNMIHDGSFEHDITGNAPGVIQTGATDYGFATPVQWFDTSDGSWGSKTWAVSASNATQGSKSMRWTATKDATGTSRSMVVRTRFMAAIPGRVYSARADVNVVSPIASGNGLRMQIQWYDSNQVIISTDDSNVIAAGTSGAQVLTMSNKAAPSNAAYAILRFLGESTGTSDVVDFFFDGVLMEAASSPGAYFDGDSANSSWLGLTGHSYSVNRPDGRVLTTLRRQQPTRISGKGMTKSVLISLVASDPRIYSSEQYRTTVAHATPITIENQGDHQCPPVLRVYGPYSAGTVEIDLTAEAVVGHYKWTKASDGDALDSVEINWLNRSVLLNPTSTISGTSMYGALDFTTTDWPVLGPGANLLRFDCSGGGTTAATIMDIRWRDAWL